MSRRTFRHQRIAGRYMEQNIAGINMLRVYVLRMLFVLLAASCLFEYYGF